MVKLVYSVLFFLFLTDKTVSDDNYGKDGDNVKWDSNWNS